MVGGGAAAACGDGQSALPFLLPLLPPLSKGIQESRGRREKESKAKTIGEERGVMCIILLEINLWAKSKN